MISHEQGNEWLLADIFQYDKKYGVIWLSLKIKW